MVSSFFKYSKFLFLFIFILCIVFIPVLYTSSFSGFNIFDIVESDISSSHDFYWPIPGYTQLSSPFGKRTSPTTGASTYHSGIDIPAPEGTKLYSISDGEVVFASWGAGGGYTITIQLSDYSDIKISYCHVSPIILVSKGDSVEKGQIVGSVGPKNVYGIINNPYKDENGNPTNRSYYWMSLTFYYQIKWNSC